MAYRQDNFWVDIASEFIPLENVDIQSVSLLCCMRDEDYLNYPQNLSTTLRVGIINDSGDYLGYTDYDASALPYLQWTWINVPFNPPISLLQHRKYYITSYVDMGVGGVRYCKHLYTTNNNLLISSRYYKDGNNWILSNTSPSVMNSNRPIWCDILTAEEGGYESPAKLIELTISYSATCDCRFDVYEAQNSEPVGSPLSTVTLSAELLPSTSKKIHIPIPEVRLYANNTSYAIVVSLVNPSVSDSATLDLNMLIRPGGRTYIGYWAPSEWLPLEEITETFGGEPYQERYGDHTVLSNPVLYHPALTYKLYKAPSLPGKPTQPTPAYSSENVSIGLTNLSWVSGGNTDYYNVYFGDSEGNLTLITTKLTNVTVSIKPFHNIFPLRYSRTYYWRVDAVNDVGTTQGDVWYFTTLSLKQPHPNYILLEGGSGLGPFDGGVRGVDWEWTGVNNMLTVRRLVAAAANKLWIESI